MPKCTLRLPFDAFRGLVMDVRSDTGLVVFDSPRSGHVARKFVKPTQPQTDLQQLIRSYVIAAAQAYKALSSAVSQDWVAAANAITRSDMLGQNYSLTGIGLYGAVNAYRLMDGQTQSATLPVAGVPAKTQILTKAERTNATTITLTGTTQGSAIVKVFGRISNPSPSTARVPTIADLRANTSGTDFTDNFAAVNGNAFSLAIPVTSAKYTVGDVIAVGIIGLSSDYLPTLLQFDSPVVVAAP